MNNTMVYKLAFRALAALMRSAFQGAMPPTNTAAEMAMHRCPAAPKAAPVNADRVASLLASGMMTAWFLAPRFACDQHRVLPTAAMPGHSTGPWLLATGQPVCSDGGAVREQSNQRHV